jgi:hypothetical protein
MRGPGLHGDPGRRAVRGQHFSTYWASLLALLQVLLCLPQFLLDLVPLLLAIPERTPHPDTPTTPDSMTQPAIESMAIFLFMLETAGLLS